MKIDLEKMQKNYDLLVQKKRLKLGDQEEMGKFLVQYCVPKPPPREKFRNSMYDPDAD